MTTKVDLRPAEAGDADDAVPLIYSSGPDAFDYVFGHSTKGDAQSLLRSAFVDGAGEFGYRNHAIAVVDGNVTGVGAGYTAETGLQFTLAAARQIFRKYGLSAPAVITRGLRTERVIPPPKKGMLYLGHLGVSPNSRSQGIGSRLVDHFVEIGRERGLATAELDVAVTNPRAQALYERLGFEVVEETESSLVNEFGRVANHRRMVLAL